MKSCNQFSLFLLLLLYAFIGGCNKGEEKAVTTQVAAKVDSTEITVSQINNVLAKTRNVTPAVEQRIKREILTNLVDQQLARQQAIEQKLDRTPDVLQALEAAKTEILARAYVAKVAAAEPKPTPEEVKSYYNEHSALFAQRRVYSIEEISLPAQTGLAATLREQATKARSLQDVAAWLKSRSIQFTANVGVRAAEQLPFEFLDKMQAVKDGEIQVFELRSGIQVIRVVASKLIPVEEANAAPRIQQFLLTQRAAEAVTKDMKAVREKAKIEYFGEFAITAEEAEAKTKAKLEATAKADAEAKAKVEADSVAKAQAKAAASAEAQERADAIAKARVESEQARRAAEANSPSPARKQVPTEIIDKGASGL